MIARLLGHPRWRAKTRAGELLEASGRSGVASIRIVVVVATA